MSFEHPATARLTLPSGLIDKEIQSRQCLYNELASSMACKLIETISWSIYQTSLSHGKVILYGNGGSCTQASHLATELSVRYKSGSLRRLIPSLNLGADPSYLTAVSNDFSWNEVFTHGLKSMAKKEDTIIGFSTSGTSSNIVNTHNWTCLNGFKSFLIIGKKDIPNVYAGEYNNIYTPPFDLSTALAQELHLFLIHLICEALEAHA